MVLAELPGYVADRLEQIGKCGVLLRQPLFGPRQPDFEQAGAHWALAGNERRPASGAGLLTIIVGEDRPFIGDAVDVGRAVAHLAAVVGTNVPVADIIAHDDEDIGLLLLCGRRRRTLKDRKRRDNHRQQLPSHVRSSLYKPPAKAKTRFQSFFMLMTTQPSFMASS